MRSTAYLVFKFAGILGSHFFSSPICWERKHRGGAIHICMASFLVLVCLPVTSQANPTAKNPGQTLAAHSTAAEAKELHGKLSKLLIDAEAFVIDAYANLEKRGPTSLPSKQLAFFRGNLRQAEFDSERLAALGEPAAVDFRARFQTASAQVQDLILRFIPTPAGQKLRTKLLAQLKQSQVNRDKQLLQIQESLEKGDSKGAESRMDAMTIELEGLSHFLYSQESDPYLKPFERVQGAVQSAAVNRRQAEAQAAFVAAVNSNAVSTQSLRDWGAQVVGQLASSGQAATGQGTAIDGPQAMEELKKSWLAVHGRLQRMTGLIWAFQGGDSYQQVSPSSLASEFSATSIQLAGQIIEADAAHLAADQVPAHYIRYLSVISEMEAFVNGSELKAGLEPSLKKLLAKNLGFQDRTSAYASSIRDLMEFEKRIYEQRLLSLNGRYPAIDQTVKKNVVTLDKQPGLLVAQSTVPMLETLMASSKLTMESIGPRLLSQPISLHRVRTLSPDAKVSVAGLESRTYGSVLKVALPLEEQARVASLLLVDAGHPPLTLAAAEVLNAVSKGNYDAVGGQIAGCQMESVITRFISMNDAASSIVPLGSVGAPSIGQMAPNQMLLRVDVVPQWVAYPLGIYLVQSESNKPSMPATSTPTASVSPAAATVNGSAGNATLPTAIGSPSQATTANGTPNVGSDALVPPSSTESGPVSGIPKL